MNYAKTQQDLAILAVNTFVRVSCITDDMCHILDLHLIFPYLLKYFTVGSRILNIPIHLSVLWLFVQCAVYVLTELWNMLLNLYDVH